MNITPELKTFLDSQRLLVIASFDKEPWITNVFYGADENGKLYFVSNEKTRHSQHILNNPNIVFSIAWFNENDHMDRKAIQGKGTCTVATKQEEIEKGIRLHNTNFPQFAKSITVNYIMSEENTVRVWIVTPTYIKHWDDKLYGIDGTKEFN